MIKVYPAADIEENIEFIVVVSARAARDTELGISVNRITGNGLLLQVRHCNMGIGGIQIQFRRIDAEWTGPFQHIGQTQRPHDPFLISLGVTHLHVGRHTGAEIETFFEFHIGRLVEGRNLERNCRGRVICQPSVKCTHTYWGEIWIRTRECHVGELCRAACRNIRLRGVHAALKCCGIAGLADSVIYVAVLRQNQIRSAVSVTDGLYLETAVFGREFSSDEFVSYIDDFLEWRTVQDYRTLSSVLDDGHLVCLADTLAGDADGRRTERSAREHRGIYIRIGLERAQVHEAEFGRSVSSLWKNQPAKEEFAVGRHLEITAIYESRFLVRHLKSQIMVAGFRKQMLENAFRRYDFPSIVCPFIVVVSLWSAAPFDYRFVSAFHADREGNGIICCNADSSERNLKIPRIILVAWADGCSKCQ